MLWVPTPGQEIYKASYDCGKSETCDNTHKNMTIAYVKGIVNGSIIEDKISINDALPQ